MKKKAARDFKRDLASLEESAVALIGLGHHGVWGYGWSLYLRTLAMLTRGK